MKNIQFFKDLLSKGARLSKKPFRILDLIKIGAPNIVGGLIAFSDHWLKIVSLIPYLALISQLLVPSFLLFYIIKIVSDKTKIENESLDDYVYNYNEIIRNISKLFLLPVIFLTAICLINSLPCGLRGIHFISGKTLKLENSEPLIGTITVFGVNGEVISKQIEVSDDEGFFYSDIIWWGSKPIRILVASGDCKEKVIHIDLSSSQTMFNSINNVWHATCK